MEDATLSTSSDLLLSPGMEEQIPADAADTSVVTELFRA
jgi:hypothetical protein